MTLFFMSLTHFSAQDENIDVNDDDAFFNVICLYKCNLPSILVLTNDIETLRKYYP